MRISHLIGALMKLQQDEGDLEVRFPSDISPDEEEEYGDSVSIEGVAFLVDENEQPAYAMICDTDTLDALS